MVIKIMRCCLPNKLVILRKHFNYSQQDLAKKLNVTINEYMAYENGNAMCSMAQLLQLADLYGISFDEMFVNSVDIELPTIDDSLEIPFIKNIEEEPILSQDKVMPSSLEETREVVFDHNLNDTIEAPVLSDGMANTQQEELAKTVVTRVIREDVASQPVKDNNTGGKKVKSKNTNMIIAALVVLAILVALVLWFVLGRSASTADNKITNMNRLFAGSNYVAYVDDNGKLSVTGDNVSLGIDDVVQVVGSDDFVAGLKEDGSVIFSNDLDVKDFHGITMIAAGDDHLVGLDTEGKIVCAGSDSACDIEKIDNVKRIDAGRDATFIITNSGELKAFGSASYIQSLDGMTGVSKVEAYNDTVAVLNKDGSVKVFAKGSYDTSKWVGIVDVACGEDFVVGLKNDGTLVYVGSDKLGKKVEGFSGVKFIGANKDYYVGCSANGKCYGEGNNSNKQFEEINTQVKLDNISNFKYTITAKKVNLTWDSVEGAQNYVVSINTSDNYSVKSATNSLSVDASKFENGKTYAVTIVAYGEDDSQSDEVKNDLYFEANTTALDSVANISGKIDGKSVIITWDEVANAKSYKVSIPELKLETSVNENKAVFDVAKFTEGTKYKVQVVAVGNDNFTDSQASEYEYLYEGVKEKLATPNNIQAKVEGDFVVFTWSNVANATEYLVTIDVEGFNQKVSANSLSVEIGKFANGNTYNVTVAAVGSGKYSDSDARSFSYMHEVKPKKCTVKYEYNGDTIAKTDVDAGTVITLSGSVPGNFKLSGYFVGGTQFTYNSDYTVKEDTTIRIEGSCAEGSQYKNAKDGCVAVENTAKPEE